MCFQKWQSFIVIDWVVKSHLAKKQYVAYLKRIENRCCILKKAQYRLKRGNTKNRVRFNSIWILFNSIRKTTFKIVSQHLWRLTLKTVVVLNFPLCWLYKLLSSVHTLFYSLHSNVSWKCDVISPCKTQVSIKEALCPSRWLYTNIHSSQSIDVDWFFVM